MDGFISRSQPLPNLPDGPHEKLSANHYHLRDGRREAQPAVLVAKNSTLKALESGLKSSEARYSTLVDLLFVP